MKTWEEFAAEEPKIAVRGRKMLFRAREHVGYAFLATLAAGYILLLANWGLIGAL